MNSNTRYALLVGLVCLVLGQVTKNTIISFLWVMVALGWIVLFLVFLIKE